MRTHSALAPIRHSQSITCTRIHAKQSTRSTPFPSHCCPPGHIVPLLLMTSPVPCAAAPPPPVRAALQPLHASRPLQLPARTPMSPRAMQRLQLQVWAHARVGPNRHKRVRVSDARPCENMRAGGGGALDRTRRQELASETLSHLAPWKMAVARPLRREAAAPP